MAQELRDVREQLQSCFETLSCFLMPDPGKHVKRSTFSGNVADLDEEFIEHSRSFVARTCAVSVSSPEPVAPTPLPHVAGGFLARATG